jgi:hypothetical protein
MRKLEISAAMGLPLFEAKLLPSGKKLRVGVPFGDGWVCV